MIARQGLELALKTVVGIQEVEAIDEDLQAQVVGSRKDQQLHHSIIHLQLY
jgi:hypothetical protein